MSQSDTGSLNLVGPIRVAKGDATYERILNAGLAQFSEFGLRRTTMEDVAKQAGIGRATAYRRFGDKHQLIQAVILRECQQQLDRIEAHVGALPNQQEALLEAFVMAVTRAHGHPLLRRLLRSEPEDILPTLTVHWSSMMALFRQQLAGQIDNANRAGTLCVHDADQVAELLLRLMQSLLLSPTGLFDPSDEASVRLLAEQYLRPWLVSQP